MATSETDWLRQLKDAPQNHSPHIVSDVAPKFTIFEVPEHIRVVAPTDFESQGLQLGLSNRTLQTSGVQLLKVELARILDAELRENYPPRSWITFADFVVPDSTIVSTRRLYQSPSNLSDSIVQLQLALDALFLVAFFQFKIEVDALDGFKDVFKKLRITKSDFILLENQVPMRVLEAANRQLCEIRNPALTEEYDIENMLDIVLKEAVIYLHPFAYPDKAGICKCGWFCGSGLGGDEHEKWFEYLEIHYPVPGPNPLSNCAHILACVYRVICGHSSAPEVEGSCAANLAAVVYSHTSCAEVKNFCAAKLATTICVCSHLSYAKVKKFCTAKMVAIRVCGGSSPAEMEDIRTLRLPALPSATVLRTSGIDVVDTARSLHEIQLIGWGYMKNATIHLPKLDIYDETELVFRNLAIYEQLANEEFGDLRSYLQCMRYLLVNAKDVDLLTRKRVVNSFVSNHNLLRIWDRATEGLITPFPSKAWLKLHISIQNHLNNRWKEWRPECYSIFFAKPWQYSRWIVASALVIFTFIQAWVAVVNAPKLQWHFVWA